MKKVLSILLAALMLLSFVPTAFAAGSINYVKINPYGREEANIDTVKWFSHSDGNHYVFLPADADLENAKVYLSASDDVKIGSKKVVNGASFAEAFGETGMFTLSCGGTTYKLCVIRSANIPAVYITTESGSLDYIHADKSNKEKGNILISKNGAVSLSGELKQIKGRGNSTWKYEKKPYNIKFDKKTAVLGMAKAKKWTLLANHVDKAFIRNSIAFDMAEALGLPFTSEYRFVDLYINGEYRGNYLICESVEIGSTRVNINDLAKDNEDANPGVDIESLPKKGSGSGGTVVDSSHLGSRKWVDIPNEPENVTGGYLLEYEFGYRYHNETSGFVSNRGQCVVIKEPEYASGSEANYIADYYNEAEDALFSESGYNSKGKHYTEYFDLDSLAAMYLLREFDVEYDSGFSSCYIFKDKDSGKFVFSPVWDSDNAYGTYAKGSRNGISLSDTSSFYTNSQYSVPGWMGAVTIPTVFTQAYKHEDLRAKVSEIWSSFTSDGRYDALNQRITDLENEISASAAMNYVRWNIYSDRDYLHKTEAFGGEVNIIRNFISGRKPTLDKGFSPDAAMLYYDGNGATNGFLTEFKPHLTGESVAVKSPKESSDPLVAPSGKAFDHWNTERDGSGTNYKAGDTIILEGKTTVLYAQWRDQTARDKANSFFERIRSVFERIIQFFRGLFG